MQPIAAEIDSEVVPFRFPSPERPLGNPLIRVENASVGYDLGETGAAQCEFAARQRRPRRPARLERQWQIDARQAALRQAQHARTAIRRASNKLEYGYFAQHQLDELHPKRLGLRSHRRADARRHRGPETGEGSRASASARTNPIRPREKLSGGEKARLLFALATFHAPHLLIFDEPTNHLDVDSREALIHALNDYEGAVILISHDRHLLEATVDRLWIVRGGTVTPYDGDLESYTLESLAAAQASHQGANGGAGAASDMKRKRDDERRQSAQRRAELAPLRKQMTAHEKHIEALQKKIAAIDFTACRPGVLRESRPRRRRRLRWSVARSPRSLKAVEEAWFEVSLAYEEAESAA